MKFLCFLALVVVCLVAAVSAGTRSQVLVHFPKNLTKKDNGYDHRAARFGKFPEAGALTHKVYYADAPLCVRADPTKGFPERTKIGNSTKMEPWHHPFILLVDRSEQCNFVKQARNAQHAGAAAVVILDNKCLCSDSACQPAADCQEEEPIMPDDGSGLDVVIPAMFLYKKEGDLMKATLKKNQGILMELNFGFDADERVNYNVWTTPTDPVSRDFLGNFQPVAQALGEHAAFEPRQYFHAGQDYLRCGSGGDEETCKELCTNNGRYCATNSGESIKGKDVVVESLRRICIWDKYGDADKTGSVWWKYTADFEEHCYKQKLFTQESCIENSYKAAGIDGALIKECMEDSGGTDGDKINSKLDLELKRRREHGVAYHPAAFVDRLMLDHSPSPFHVFQALCTSMSFGAAPDICYSCGWCPDTAGCIELGSCDAARKRRSKEEAKKESSGDKKHNHHHFLKSLFSLMIFGACGYVGWTYYKERLQQRPSGGAAQGDERGVLADYMHLTGEEDTGQMPLMNPAGDNGQNLHS